MVGCRFHDPRNEGTCKREKVGSYVFKKNPFSAERCCLYYCKDCVPPSSHKYIMARWINADHYREQEKAELGEHYRKPRYVSYIVNSDKDTYYHVRYDDFYNGNLIRPDGKFNAYEKQYYKRVRTGCGYRLITEEVDGVELK